MLAGLIVAMSVVALSAQATNTFHEESRVAGAEMQIRAAMDRLRADIARASFMSTGNIYIDPGIYNANPGQVVNVANVPVAYNGAGTGMTLSSLAGIRLWPGGSVAGANGAALSTINNLSPDMIDIGGNMTGVEVLPIGGAATGLPAIEKVGCGGNGWRIHLNYNSSPALWRLVGNERHGDHPLLRRPASIGVPTLGADGGGDRSRELVPRAHLRQRDAQGAVLRHVRQHRSVPLRRHGHRRGVLEPGAPGERPILTSTSTRRSSTRRRSPAASTRRTRRSTRSRS